MNNLRTLVAISALAIDLLIREREKASNFVSIGHQPEKETRGREQHVGQISVLTRQYHSHQSHCSDFLISLRRLTMDAQTVCFISHFRVLRERRCKALSRILLFNFQRALLCTSWHKFFARRDFKLSCIDNLREDLSLACHFYHVCGRNQERRATHHAENYCQEEVSSVRETAGVWSWSHKSQGVECVFTATCLKREWNGVADRSSRDRISII